MKIILQSPSADNIIKNRNKIIKYSNVLFKDYYKSFRRQSIQALIENKRVDLSSQKEDFKALLKMIYKKIILSNPNSVFSYKIKSEKIDFTQLEDKTQDILNSELDKIVNTRADLIFNNLIKSISKLSENSRSEVNEKIILLQEAINDKRTTITSLAMSNTLQSKKTTKELEISIQQLEKQLQKIREQKENLILSAFTKKYNDKIVNEKSKLHSQNEVDYYDEKTREKELSTLAVATSLKIGNDFFNITQQTILKEWQNPLDERSRITHAEAHGQVRKDGDYFEIRNPKTNIIEYCKHPRDDTLSPENSINCRCTLEIRIELNLQENTGTQQIPFYQNLIGFL